jgi:biotin transport system substrate-specific component
MLNHTNLLIARLFPALKINNFYQAVLLAIAGTFALTLEAKIQIPLYPVKISMQPFVSILLGCLYGRRLAVATVALYLLEGALGLPVFQGTPDRGIGLSYMLGPTGGYLMGFMLAAFVVGTLSERGMGRTLWSAGLLFTIGAVVNDIAGISWLTYLMGIEVAKNVYLSYQLAFLLKLGLFSALLPLIWRSSNRD